LEQKRFGTLETEMDRIDRDDTGKHRLIGYHAVADVHESFRDEPGDWRSDGGEADLELLGFDIGAGCIDFRYAGSDSGPALLDFLLAGRLRCGERFRTRELGAGICEKSFSARLLRPRLRQRGSRGAR